MMTLELPFTWGGFLARKPDTHQIHHMWIYVLCIMYPQMYPLFVPNGYIFCCTHLYIVNVPTPFPCIMYYVKTNSPTLYVQFSTPFPLPFLLFFKTLHFQCLSHYVFIAPKTDLFSLSKLYTKYYLQNFIYIYKV